MLNKRHRLKSRKLFARTLDAQRIGVTGVFAVYGLSKNAATPPDATLRIGIIVSKKVDKRAVIRNLVKRRIRQILREQIKNGLETRPFATLVIIARPAIVTTPYTKLSELLTKTLLGT